MPPRSGPAPPRAERALRGAALLLSGIAVATYAAIAARVVAYPYQLEWMEGGTLDVVRRVVEGQPLYVTPHLEYVPYLYTPLYYQVAAVSARLLGLDFAAARAVSLLATLGVCALIFSFARREVAADPAARGGASSGVLGVGLYLASFGVTGMWFHVARVDSLFLFLVLAGAWALRFAPGLGGAALGGLLLALAFLTKQSALLCAAPLALALLWGEPRRGLVMLASFALPALAATLALQAASDGWFAYYAFELARGHEVLWSQALAFWYRDTVRMAPAFAVGAVALALLWRTRPRAGRFHAALAAGLVAAAWSARIHSGGFDNVLMPAFAAGAILMPIGLALWTAHPPDRPRGISAGLQALAVLQLVLLAYDPRAAVPSRADRLAGDRFVEYVSGLEGEVFIPDHRFVQTRVGKASFGWGGGGWDILRGAPDPVRTALLEELAEALLAQRFDAILLHPTSWLLRVPEFRSAYEFREAIFAPDDDLYRPVTGLGVRPDRVFVPRRDDASGGETKR